MRLSGEVAIVTGGASGIGRATSILFAKEGAKVCIADIDKKRGERLSNKINLSGGTALFVKIDVTEEKQVESLIDNIGKNLGTPTVLVTAAGTNIQDMDIVDYDMEKWDWLLNLNLRSVLISCKHALKVMVKKKSGSIVNIASSAGIEAIPRLGAYCTSKAGVIMLTKVLALENARNNIRVNCICPGNTMTPLLKMAISVASPLRRRSLGSTK